MICVVRKLSIVLRMDLVLFLMPRYLETVLTTLRRLTLRLVWILMITRPQDPGRPPSLDPRHPPSLSLPYPVYPDAPYAARVSTSSSSSSRDLGSKGEWEERGV